MVIIVRQNAYLNNYRFLLFIKVERKRENGRQYAEPGINCELFRYFVQMYPEQ